MKLTYKISGRFVNYHEIKVYLTADEKYIAADKDGRIYAFQDKPVCCNTRWDPFEGGLCRKLGVADLEDSDWKESLKHFSD